jgi:two-component system, cell cycle response regulator DivK
MPWEAMMAKGTILVIEDNLDNLDLVKFLLEETEFQVFTATDGREGLNQAREKHPDLLLLDLTIPEIDGWSVANLLKASPETENIKIVAMTAHTMPRDRKKALDAGCDGYITKPLDIPSFASMVKSYFAG